MGAGVDAGAGGEEEVFEPEVDQVTIKKRREPTLEERRTSLREEGAEINCLVARTALILPFSVMHSLILVPCLHDSCC